MSVCLLGFRFCFANMLCLLAWIFFLELKSNQSVFVTTMHFRRHQHHQHHHHPRYLSSSSSVARKVKRICKTPLSVFCSVCYRFLDFYLQYWKCNHLNHGGVVVVLSMHVRTCSCREVEGLSVCLSAVSVCLSVCTICVDSERRVTDHHRLCRSQRSSEDARVCRRCWCTGHRVPDCSSPLCPHTHVAVASL